MKFPEKYRIKDTTLPMHAYLVERKNFKLVIIASDNDGGWEHVSVSLKHRCPNWDEMCFIKSLFWEDDECVVQFHPPKKEYVNVHPHCLHLWKPKDKSILMPPSFQGAL